MLHLNRLKSLLDFLRVGEPSVEGILKFVALDTLYEFGAMTLFLNVVRRDGSVNISHSFGADKEAMKLIPERLVSVETPINRSLRTGVIAECGDSENFLFAGTGYVEKVHPGGFAYSVAWPIPGVGSVVTFCSKRVELSLADQEFLLSVGEILAVELTRVHRNIEFAKGSASLDKASNISLTPRQWTILTAIQKGHTNAEIAGDLGFSESLVRQETVQIYRKLGVAGRKEILESDREFMPTGSPDADPEI
jgi:DNA-binding CsgD family transcriptional regulator